MVTEGSWGLQVSTAVQAYVSGWRLSGTMCAAKVYTSEARVRPPALAAFATGKASGFIGSQVRV